MTYFRQYPNRANRTLLHGLQVGLVDQQLKTLLRLQCNSRGVVARGKVKVMMMRPQKVDGWHVEPFSDLSASFFFAAKPVRVKVVGKLGLWVFQNCDGRTITEIVAQACETFSSDPACMDMITAAVEENVNRLAREGIVE